MKLGWLFDAFHGSDLRQDFAQKSAGIQHKKCQTRAAFREHLCKLVANPLGGNLAYLWGQFLYGLHRPALKDVSKSRGKAYGPQHAQLVFTKTFLWIADGADDPGFQILATSNVVENIIG